MPHVTIHAGGPRPPDEVWERYARPAVWPSWSPQICRVECDHERLERGVHGRVVGPLGIGAGFVVDEWDEQRRRWSWRVFFGPLRLRMDHGVDARATGCDSWLRIGGPLPVALAYLPLARLALHRLVH